jgi:hypothetical protein
MAIKTLSAFCVVSRRWSSAAQGARQMGYCRSEVQLNDCDENPQDISQNLGPRITRRKSHFGKLSAIKKATLLHTFRYN